MKKRKLGVILAIVMGICSIPTFVGCSKSGDDSKTVMNVALNPEVEFILDEKDKVLSVNALNEEGNLIISAEAFTNVEGKTAEEAAKLFVQVSKETGFLIEGNINAGENELKISLSGDTKEAEELYNQVKSKIDTYLSSENITATIKQTEAITKEKLEELVAKCNPYIEETKIKAMEYQSLVDELIKSRQETAEMYSQEIKNAYYEAKAFALEQAKLETLKSKVDPIKQITLTAINTIYTGLVDEITRIRQTTLVDENSLYQKTLAQLREAKIEYINYRNYVSTLQTENISIQITTNLANLKTALENAETALIEAGEAANQALTNAKKELTTAYNNLITAIENASVKASDYLDEISVKQTQAITDFTTQFETNYNTNKEIAKNQWKEMREKMVQGYQENAE